MTQQNLGTIGLFIPLLILLGAAVLAVPLAKRCGLGAVVGYLVAGVLIGPQVLGLFRDPASVMHVSELGIMMFLFLIGLEMQPSKVWAMRRDIFGLGGLQMLLTGLVVTCVPLAFGRTFQTAIIAGFGLAISSTAILMQVLEERGEVRAPHGQRAFAIAIFQDLMIVPLLAMVAFLAPQPVEVSSPMWLDAVKIIGALVLVVTAGEYLLNPLFRLLANTNAREIMTAAALLVVVGAAVILSLAGLSMAMGAFLAGVFLAESNFRHQLEADVEPFRGLLMGLFFLSVGMTLDLHILIAQWPRILFGLVVMIVLKFLILYGIMRLFRHSHGQSVRVALLLSQAGEFGFVLYATAVSSGVMAPEYGSLLVALVVMSMAITPFLYRLVPYLFPEKSLDIEEDFSQAGGSVLMIGFGRFGQIVSQCLMARGFDITALDRDPASIQAAGRFGFKVYFGDGRRLDVLRAARLDQVRLVCICVNDRNAATQIVDLLKETVPDLPLFVRAFDRRHALELRSRQVAFELRETVESALSFGRVALEHLGLTVDEAMSTIEDIRERDNQRLQLQQEAGVDAGRELLHRHPVVEPEPLSTPRRKSEALNVEASDALTSETQFSG